MKIRNISDVSIRLFSVENYPFIHAISLLSESKFYFSDKSRLFKNIFTSQKHATDFNKAINFYKNQS